MEGIPITAAASCPTAASISQFIKSLVHQPKPMNLVMNFAESLHGLGKLAQDIESLIAVHNYSRLQFPTASLLLSIQTAHQL
jgi:hypothetical protein